MSKPRNSLLLLLLLAPACADSDALASDGDPDAGEELDAGADAADSAVPPVPVVSCPDPNEPIDPTAVIDDFEDRTALLPPVGNRNGGWWIASDDTVGATVEPPRGSAPPELVPGGRCGSTFAAHVSGQGFNDWGSLLGMSFAYDSAGTAPYDASIWQGITFWARIGDTSTNAIRFAIGDVYSDPLGGLCDPAGGDMGCYDTFGVPITSLDTTWKRYKIPFQGLSQRDFGWQSTAVTKEQLYTLQFTFEPGVVFDLWIDDISFY